VCIVPLRGVRTVELLVVRVLLVQRAVVELGERRPRVLNECGVHQRMRPDERCERIEMIAFRLAHRPNVLHDRPEAGRSVVGAEDLEHAP
jgi:hypothetical protein